MTSLTLQGGSHRYITLQFLWVRVRVSSIHGEKHSNVCVFFFFFSHTFTFQLLDKPWSQVSSLLPLGSCLHFRSRIGFSNPTARRFFIECCQLTLSRFPQVNLCTRKSPHEFIRVCMHSGEIELTKLIYTRLEDNLKGHQGDR